jgi:NAD(P)-dependent dehydrogenase (short-subunit alcohol dehydrogenase family)
MHEKPVVLVTGQNKEVGLQIAKDLSMHGLTVVVGSRILEAAESAVKIVGDDARAVQLDVTDPDSIAGAAKRVGDELGRLDVLVSNASISRADVPGRSFDQAAATDPRTVASLDEVRTVFETNVFGVIAVTQAVRPILREAPAGRIVNIGSSAGSLTRHSDLKNPRPWMFGTYSASKAASHAITVASAAELESTGIKVNAACPGFTSTDLNDFLGTRTVAEAAHEPVRLALLDADGPTEMLSNEDGPVPR